MPSDDIQFGTLNPDGSVTNARTISSAAIRACPHFILAPEHYRTDGSCRCNDPDSTTMREWGYEWSDGAWR